MDKYIPPKQNRGDKDPYGLSDRLKLYGNDIEVYDIDNMNNTYVSCYNFTIKNILEFKTGEVKEGIYRAPLTMLGQLCQLYFSVYPAYLCYCIALEDNKDIWSYIVVPVNYSAANKTGGASKLFSESSFQKKIFSPYSENTADLQKTKPTINKIELFSEYGNAFSFGYNSIENIEGIIKKERYDKINNIPFCFYDKGLSELLENEGIYNLWAYEKTKYCENK